MITFLDLSLGPTLPLSAVVDFHGGTIMQLSSRILCLPSPLFVVAFSPTLAETFARHCKSSMCRPTPRSQGKIATLRGGGLATNGELRMNQTPPFITVAPPSTVADVDLPSAVTTGRLPVEESPTSALLMALS
ncbi:uncharacterized protein DS421_10g306830 [Arachis hypogaea]|nr:uncharacterized protein DS421_10g306830 [Arachis hypogaea]